jgi:ABC-type uncharacterized transport system permease subunit
VSPARRPPPAEERRRLFRRMEWVFVWLPPLLAVFIGVFGAAFLAWFFRIHGTTFAQRWVGGTVLLLGGTGAAYLIHRWWVGDEDEEYEEYEDEDEEEDEDEDKDPTLSS